MTQTMSKSPIGSAGTPSEWRERKLKFIADVQTSNIDKHTFPDEIPVFLCNYTDVYYNDRIISSLQFMKGSVTESELERFSLNVGQVLLGRVNNWV